MHANARPLPVSVVLCAHASLFIVVVHVHYLGACGSVLSTLILSVRVSKRPYKRAANRRKRYLQMIFARFFTRFEGRFDFLKSPKSNTPTTRRSSIARRIDRDEMRIPLLLSAASDTPCSTTVWPTQLSYILVLLSVKTKASGVNGGHNRSQ